MDAYLKIRDEDIHDALNKAVSSAIKNLNLDRIILDIVDKKLEQIVKKNISDGSFVLSVANKIAGNIKIDDIKEFVDVKSLNDTISNRMAKNLLSKMSFT